MKGIDRLQWLVLVAMLFSGMVSASEGEFPLREKFSDVKTVSVEALNAGYDEFVIVDARSRFEFDTIHISKAVRIPISSKSFQSLLAKRVPDKEAKVAFYCNGYTCSKSYRAAAAATRAGYRNAYAFDAGIFEWTKANPARSTLLGESPVDPEQLIPKSVFNDHLLDFEQFKQKAAESGAVVIDVRDAAQRRNSDGTKNELPDMPNLSKRNDLKLNMDLLKRKLNERKYRGKQLLIFDATGKQVKWLQYSLEKNGYSNYHFLKGGIYSVTKVVHK